jgi:hypothetical protein
MSSTIPDSIFEGSIWLGRGGLTLDLDSSSDVPPTSVLTEDGDHIITEDGDALIQE